MAFYTQVSIRALKAVHTATHPARPIGSAAAHPGAGAADAPEDIDALVDALDREAEEDEDEPFAARMSA
jgi:integrase/recombinase XerD